MKRWIKILVGKMNSPIFSDRTELNAIELALQALIDISPPLSLNTKKC
jgi:hypothetical protein